MYLGRYELEDRGVDVAQEATVMVDGDPTDLTLATDPDGSQWLLPAGGARSLVPPGTTDTAIRLELARLGH